MAQKRHIRQLGYELQKSHVFEMCSNIIFLCLVLIDIHHEGAGKSVVASVKGPKKAYRRIL